MSAVLSSIFNHNFIIFVLKNQLKNRINWESQISHIKKKKKNQAESPENITQETNKKNARSIQQFKCLLVFYILGYFLGERWFLQYLL